MSERCNNCGSELFAGQQFCRRCGAAVRASGGEAPTQLFPQGAPTALPDAGTAHPGGRGTDPVRDPRPTGHQTPLGSLQQTSPLAAPPPARRKGRGLWVVALVAVAVLSVLGTLGFVHALRARKSPERIYIKKGGPGEHGLAPPAPPEMPARVREAAAAAGAPLPLDESRAEVTSGQTEFTQSFELSEAGSFSLRNFSGAVTVEGWDEARAEVRIVKRGGTPEQRRAVPVLSARREGSLALTTHAGPRTPVTVAFELKLPRSLRQFELAAENSDVRVSGLEGTVVVDVKAGRLEFRDVTGTVRSQIIKGHTKVFYERADREGPQEFKANLGDVELSLPEEFHADLKAETLDGRIEADDALGLTVSQAPAGRHAVGRLGEGREPLLIRVVNGDIKLKK